MDNPPSYHEVVASAPPPPPPDEEIASAAQCDQQTETGMPSEGLHNPNRSFFEGFLTPEYHGPFPRKNHAENTATFIIANPGCGVTIDTRDPRSLEDIKQQCLALNNYSYELPSLTTLKKIFLPGGFTGDVDEIHTHLCDRPGGLNPSKFVYQMTEDDAAGYDTAIRKATPRHYRINRQGCISIYHSRRSDRKIGRLYLLEYVS